MCDSFAYIPFDNTSPVIFGKNSDREPNEAQQIVIYPAHIRKDERVKATYIWVDSKREVYEIILSKPFQMWGAEMGVNEKGVAIGNEAVFTKMPKVKRNIGLTGMDLVRLGLEYGQTAEDALGIIIQYLQEKGQNACGGYQDKKFFYHNSFLIADKQTAYVLETAGPFWAYKKVSGYYAISNGLTIEEDFDEIADGAIDFACGKYWISKSSTFNFRKAFSAYFMPRLAGCEMRRSMSETLGKVNQNWNVSNAFQILRSHRKKIFTPSKGKTDSLCMHASGLMCPHQTTGSMVAELRKDGPPTIWLTGSSAPCLSLFKPFYLNSDVLSEAYFRTPGARPDESYWWRFERFHRKAIRNYQSIIREVQNDQELLESGWIEKDKDVFSGSIDQKNRLSRSSLEESLAALDAWQSGLEKKVEQSTYGREFLYQRFWKNQDKQVNL